MKHIGEVVNQAVAELEPTEWVNAEVRILVPLDVPIDASDDEKAAATHLLLESVVDHLPADLEHVATAAWEDVRSLGEAA